MKIVAFEFNYFGVNTYIVWDETTREAAIVDPGMLNQNECDIFANFIKDNKLNVKYLINTHMHIDHVMGDDFVADKYNIGISANKEDAFLGSGREMQAQMFHLRKVKTSPLKIEHQLKQGDKLFLGSEWLEIVEVPGHSPGSIALYSPSDNFIITGDALFNGSIGRTDLPGGDYSTLINNIKNNLLSLPPETIVYPGHGPSTTIYKEKTQNPFLH